jgi:hypothetical protein
MSVLCRAAQRPIIFHPPREFVPQYTTGANVLFCERWKVGGKLLCGEDLGESTNSAFLGYSILNTPGLENIYK